MSALYLDASAFVKVVVTEPESSRLRAFLRRRPERRISSTLLRAEAVRAVGHLDPDVIRRVRMALRRIDLVGIDDRILERAGTLDPTVLRMLDAIHLSTALAIGPDLDAVVTYDERMIEGAETLGLNTASPR